MARNPKSTAVEEITVEQYQRCLSKMANLPEAMRPVVPPPGMPTVGEGIPAEVPKPKKIELVASLESVLQPVAVEVAPDPTAKPKVNPTSRLGKHATKRTASTLPTD